MEEWRRELYVSAGRPPPVGVWLCAPQRAKMCIAYASRSLVNEARRWLEPPAHRVRGWTDWAGPG